MDGNGNACVSEYGLELVLREEASSESFPINVRWTAPEVFSATNKNKRASLDEGKRADIYSFGLVMFEVRYSNGGKFDSESWCLTPDPRS